MRFLRRQPSLPRILKQLIDTGAPVAVVSVQPGNGVVQFTIWPQMKQVIQVPLDELSMQLDVTGLGALGTPRTARVMLMGSMVDEPSVLLPESTT